MAAALREEYDGDTSGGMYGWGMVPVEVCLGRTRWRTSLFPKEGGYVLPLRDSVRRREHVELGDLVSIELTVSPSGQA